MSDFPVIGICGPSDSGKDLVGDWFLEKKHFTKVAFADPMKRYAQKVFGYSYDTLWGPADLRNVDVQYPDEWWFGIIGNVSLHASDLLREVVPQGDRMRAFLTLAQWVADLRAGCQKKGTLSCREVLQTLGTEWGREKVDQFVWVNYLHKIVVPALRDTASDYTQEGGIKAVVRSNDRSGIIIPDHRFENEIEATQRMGGYVILLRRLSLVEKNKTSNVGIEGHRSETEQRGIPDSAYDLVLELPEGVENVYAKLEEVFKEKAWESKRRASSVTDTTTTESSSPTA